MEKMNIYCVNVEQEAYEMPSDSKKVMLKIEDISLYSSGVFSNVYRGLLKEPVEKKIAIKKTWPDVDRKKFDRNFEFIFLTGRERAPHKNIIQMLYAFSHDYGSKVCESYVFDFMPTTLADVLKTLNPTNAIGPGLDEMDIRLYTWQIFAGLKYLEEHLIIHRDLKPANILVDHDAGTLKINDFGSSKCFIKNKPSESYQIPRFYRPPEMCLKSTDYDSTVDVWSAGCCVGEMIKKGQILFPGKCSAHQFKLYCRCFGCPSEADFKAMKTPESCRLPPDCMRYSKGSGLLKLLPGAKEDQLGFLKRVFQFAPEKRFRGIEALKDDYFQPLFVPQVCRSNDQLVSKSISPEDYRNAIEVAESNSRRFALLTLCTKPATTPKQLLILPACEKSLSFEKVNQNKTRRSTLLPHQQKFARDLRSREDLSFAEQKSTRKRGPRLPNRGVPEELTGGREERSMAEQKSTRRKNKPRKSKEEITGSGGGKEERSMLEPKSSRKRRK
ncbi:unnamed protein product [Caenorhabditis angaria]|uniref:Protein kinase domain-containing protein n=1 Tax=Caenorhabditis angaria TaxID=860376 RepID=A0A9P1IH27_9PELO|nr:unnamed protein product [Caenorhabditis angaria]